MSNEALAALIFGLTYLAIASERVNRTTAALVGATVMIAVKLDGFGQREAFQSIDFNVIFLLMGMMVQVGVLAKTGVFRWLALRSAKLAQADPVRLLVIFALVTAVLSAFLDNVTTVILIAPVTIALASALGVRAMPFLISEAIASNIGGSATLIGDPPNIIIGSAAGLDFVYFLTNVMPIIVLILIAYLLLAPRLFRDHLTATDEARARVMQTDEQGMITRPRLLYLSLGVLFFTIAGFCLHGVLHYEPATVALAGAAALLLLGRQDPHEALMKVEWSTLLFFVGLFIIVGGAESTGMLSDLGQRAADLVHGSPTTSSLSILSFAAVVSGFVDNIPYTAAMIPVVREVGSGIGSSGGPGNVLWWSLALGACLGGNLTIVAAAANVLVANLAERTGERIGFWQFFRYGSIVTLLSIAVSAGYPWLRYLAF